MDAGAPLRAEFATQVKLAQSLHEKHRGSNTAASRAAKDRAIARWSVFQHLQGCALNSPETLLTEVHRLRAAGLPVPVAHVHRQETYEQARVALLHSLATRFEIERAW